MTIIRRSGECKKTGKVRHETATSAIESLKAWRTKNPDVCWDTNRMRVYRCQHCHRFHLGRYYGKDQWLP